MFTHPIERLALPLTRAEDPAGTDDPPTGDGDTGGGHGGGNDRPNKPPPDR